MTDTSARTEDPDRDTWDVLVLGAGSTGENVADRAVRGGLSAAIVEADLVGGDCSYWACMPSKALLRPGQVLREAQAVPGVPLPPDAELDPAAVLARRDAFASGWSDDGQVRWLDGAGIDLIRGHGRLSGERRVTVEAGGQIRTLAARRAVVLATGSRPAMPPIPGLAQARPWTTRDATSAKQPPERLLVLGGGVAGCELAQAWNSLGSRVALLEGADRLLSKTEPFAGELVAESLRGQGVDVRTGTRVTGVSRAGDDGPVTVTLDDGGQLTADELLVVTGRAPRTDDLGLETVGLTPGEWIGVDDSMRATGVPGGWLYAAGDVNGRVLLTHQGKYQARVAGDVIAARARREAAEPPAWSRYAATADHTAVPQVVFTDPEVAAVGLSEEVARARGHQVDVAEYAMGSVAGATLFADGYTGRAKIVIDRDRRVLLGATFVGPGAGELLHAATIAVVDQMPLDRLWHAVPAYPTISEVWLRLLEAYGL
jgi:pyruvate/2-oxoglutarate dehydrogenase complex dihydrolipoamide dehydrogenase (E3) component